MRKNSRNVWSLSKEEDIGCKRPKYRGKSMGRGKELFPHFFFGRKSCALTHSCRQSAQDSFQVLGRYFGLCLALVCQHIYILCKMDTIAAFFPLFLVFLFQFGFFPQSSEWLRCVFNFPHMNLSLSLSLSRSEIL